MECYFCQKNIKEIDFKARKPFWFLLLFILVFAIIMIHPPIALFSFAMIYLSWGIIENTYLFYRNRYKVRDTL